MISIILMGGVVNIVVFTQAGGAGKSTVSLNLLYTLKEIGAKNVKIVTNEQAHGFGDLLAEDEFVVIPERGSCLPELPDAGITIFDFAGKTDGRIKEAVEIADHVLVPTKGESKNKIEQFTATVDDLSDFTDNITIVVTEYNKKKKSRLLEYAHNYLLRYPTFPLKESEAFNIMWDLGVSVRSQYRKGGLNKTRYAEVNKHFNDLVTYLVKGSDK